MKKGIAAIMGILTVALTAAAVWVYMAEDRQGPEIRFTTEPVYTGAEDTSYLLDGIVAIDKKDGDVTDSLRVEKVQVNEETQQVTIIYIAKDNSNNVTKVNKTVLYNAAAGQTEPDTSDESAEGEDAEATSADDAAEPTPAEPSEPAPTPIPEAMNGEQENEEKIAALPEGSPAFYLSQYELELEVGSSFNVLGYVEEITDDVDERDWLFQHIQVVGEVDTNTPGTYEVIYFVIDSDGNSSNEAVLMVTVKPNI